VYFRHNFINVSSRISEKINSEINNILTYIFSILLSIFLSDVFNFPGTNAAYVAVGLSDDAKMGDDLTTECVPENGRVNLYSSLTSASPYAAVRSSVVSLE